MWTIGTFTSQRVYPDNPEVEEEKRSQRFWGQGKREWDIHRPKVTL